MGELRAACPHRLQENNGVQSAARFMQGKQADMAGACAVMRW